MIETTADQTITIETLNRRVAEIWQELTETCRFIRAIKTGEITRGLYGLYLVETYHYTRHNARNQALVGVRIPDDDRFYQKFCFHHAEEEVGHEQMARHDLISLGLDQAPIMPPPLPSTEVLIAYLYWVSYQGNPFQRLGYSFWAENCYAHVRPLMQQVQQTLKITPAQMSFFVAHAEIDVEHSEMVNDMISKRCRTQEDWQAVAQVMETSLRLTGRMMDEVYDEYLRLLDGRTDRGGFLRTL